MKRDAGQIEHLQQVGVVELVLQRDAQKVGFGHRSPGLQGQKRDARPRASRRWRPPKAGRPARPRRPPSRGQVVEDLDGLVGDGDLVGVGEAEDHAQLGRDLR